jgi:MoaA/NifB/PqqE/SkfB family radical SAM enzyme/2-polyprenyl-3-methyl-5-hydroxy-6-metoxy-1,4-benzoquinol methylase
MECPICYSNNSVPFYKYGAPRRIKVENVICVNCGLVYQNTDSTYNDLKNYYENYIKMTQKKIAHIPHEFEEHVLAIARLRLSYLKDYLKEGDSVLDIGCSFGALMKVLKEESGLKLELVGVNPEYDLAQYGREKYKIDIRVGMFEEQNFPPQYFDMVIMDNVLEHIKNPREVIRNVYNLLRKGGKIFIATNDVAQLHGFPWQNFFPDHMVTFSLQTLRILLESQGFRIVNQNNTGHVTFEGYHYPYQYCIAEKDTVPLTYDFREKGDNYELRIKNFNKYVKDYYKSNRFAKKAYEYSLNEYFNLGGKKFKIPQIFSMLCLKISNFRLYNHTLPPEDYYYRRLFIAECKTDEDIKLALKLGEKSGMSRNTIVLKKFPRGIFKLYYYPQQLFLTKPPNFFKSRTSFWKWLISNSPRIDETIALRLDNADLKDDCLLNSYKIHQEKGREYSFVDYRQFTEARWEIISGNQLQNIKETNDYEDNLVDLPFTKDFPVIWPGDGDYQYYLKEKFKNYFSVPKCISLDLSPFCNMKCNKCQFHSARSPYSSKLSEAKMMPVELVKKIIDETKSWKVKPTLAPTFSGEPLLYPQLYDVLEYAKKMGFPIGITTNGLALNEKISRYLLELGIDSLVVSIDAVDEETYRLLQPPGNLKKVRDNLQKLIQLRGHKKKPSIGVHFVMEKRNHYQFEEFLEFWGNKVDYVSRAIMQDQFSNCQPVLPVWYPLGKRQACWAAWTTLYVRWNGDISFCGFDIGGDTSGLNIQNSSIVDIWNSEEFWHWRDAQLNNDMSILYCKGCPDWAGMRSVTEKNGDWKVTRTAISETYTRIN